MQHDQTITADPPSSHLTEGQVRNLAHDAAAQFFLLNVGKLRIQRGSFHRDFVATADGVFRAAPIRSWLGG